LPCSLNFGIDHNTICIEFTSDILRQKYIDAEFSDPTCQLLYAKMQAALDKTTRLDSKRDFHTARYRFFKHWAMIHMPEIFKKSADTVPPPDLNF
jgi:hypothetical protein